MSEKVINPDVARDRVSSQVIDCALYVHRQLGPGLLESAYQECLSIIMHKRGLSHRNQVSMGIVFEDTRIENAYRLDMIVEDRLIVELKATEKILPIHEAQMLTYLRLSGIKSGLLINFNAKLLKNGLKRFVM